MSGAAKSGAALRPDLCVVGASADAHEMVLGALALKASVVLVEPEDAAAARGPAGLPAAVLIAAARRFGGPPRSDGAARWAEARARLAVARAELAPNHRAERFAAAGARVLAGPTTFLDARSLSVGGETVRARRTVLAMGDRPVRPALPGILDVLVIDCEGLLDAPAAPRRVLVVGSDGDAVAIAHALSRFGVEIVLLTPGDLLPAEDPELSGAVRRLLRAAGVDLREGCQPERAERKGEGVTLHVSTGTATAALDGSHIIGPAWRGAALEASRIERAGLAFDAAGRIQADTRGRSANRRVYVVGAMANGGPARPADALRHALTGLAAPPPTPVRVVRTDPPAVQVGLTEAESRVAFGAPAIARWPLSETESGIVDGQGAGFVKVVADRKGRVRGVSLFGADATHAAALWTLAVRQAVSLDEIAAIAGPQSAMLAASRRAVTTLLLPRLARPAVRVALRLARLAG